LLALWASGATFGPDLGPVLGGFSIAAENWHWNAWIMLWLSGPMFITMFFFYPKPSSANILLRRA
jgi:DHA1 family multidrug resistance protein-like MFS transporter